MGGIKRRRSCRVEKMTPNRAPKAKAMMVALSISRTGSESLAQRGRIGIPYHVVSNNRERTTGCCNLYHVSSKAFVYVDTDICCLENCLPCCIIGKGRGKFLGFAVGKIKGLGQGLVGETRYL